jgi:hypothetical protein
MGKKVLVFFGAMTKPSSRLKGLNGLYSLFVPWVLIFFFFVLFLFLLKKITSIYS